MAATFPLPAAVCPMVPANGRWSRATKPQRPARLDRYPHAGAKAAHRAVAERDVAAMRARDVAGDRKSQSGAALVLVAGIIQPQERLEHFLTHVGRNAGTVIVDRDRQIAVIAMAGDRKGIGMPRGVGHEIAEAAFEGGR